MSRWPFSAGTSVPLIVSRMPVSRASGGMRVLREEDGAGSPEPAVRPGGEEDRRSDDEEEHMHAAGPEDVPEHGGEGHPAGEPGPDQRIGMDLQLDEVDAEDPGDHEDRAGDRAPRPDGEPDGRRDRRADGHDQRHAEDARQPGGAAVEAGAGA